MIKAKNEEKIPIHYIELTHQLSFTNINLKVDYHTVGKWFIPWWRHQMETFSALLAICAGNSLATGEFPTQRPVTRSLDVFFDLRLNKLLRKQS